MKKITLLHTVASVYGSFKGQLEAAFDEELEVNSLVDEFLVTNARKKGYFPPENRKKLLLDLMSAEAEGADVIIVTCSSLSPFVEEYRNVLSIPVVTIDRQMCIDAATKGVKIAVLATAPTTIEPTTKGIQREADKMGKKVEISSLLDEEAMNLLKKGDVTGHDARLAELARKAGDVDVIVLAQASMATAAPGCEKATGKIILTSPGSCIAEAKALLEKK